MSNIGPMRPRDWPASLMSTLHSTRLHRLHLPSGGEIEAASHWLTRMLDERRPDSPPEYLLEAAYFSAAHLHAPVAARKWLAMESRDAEPWVRGRTEGAIALAAGDLAEAQL
jgi:hypothetical protein